MRKITFYPHLAVTNILRNNQFYFPYLLSNTATVGMFYILVYLSSDTLLNTMPSANNVRIMMRLGCIVVGIFSVILVFYTNRFVMKRRQHELGLYSILGMETRHIARLLRVEALFLGLCSLICGLVAGIVLSKLILLLLLRLLHFPVSMGFSISLIGLAVTTVLFTLLFLLVLLYNLLQLHRSNPVDLLRSNSVGEREPKVKWLLTLVGVVTLVAGYWMANTIQSPLKALTYFFVAVILVIIGTYCIFTAGSIAVLKLLRANKRYYYQPQHFTTVSGLLYRMKQNAVGLASICILSTMLLVTVSTTFSLYFSVESSLDSVYPRDMNLSVALNQDIAPNDVLDLVEEQTEQAGYTVEQSFAYTALTFPALMDSTEQFTLDGDRLSNEGANYSALCVITAETYNQHHQTPLTLKPGQVAYYGKGQALADTFRLQDQTFTIAQRLEEPPLSFYNAHWDIYHYTTFHYLVVSDEETFQTLYQLQKNALQSAAYDRPLVYTICFDLDASDDDIRAFTQDFSVNFNSEHGYSYNLGCRQTDSLDFYTTYGGFLFLGLFLGTLFLIGTVLIIYFKQISEGYEDQKRFEILQKVGLSQREVRRSIHSQILLVFFLPLVTAMIHVFGAFHMITKLLALFLNDANLQEHFFLLCTLGTLAGFAIIYALVYWATAHTYYKIVRVGQTSSL